MGCAEEAAPTVRIDFTDDDGVDGSLAKTFAGAKGRVELTIAGESITDPAEVERRLADLTGIPSEKFFRSTAAVRHEELADLDRDESTLRDRLQEAMSGADRGTGAARKKLVDAIARYTASGAKNPGIIKSLTDTTTTLEASLRDGEAALGRLEEERAALSRARDALAVAEQRLEVDRDSLAAAERAVALKTTTGRRPGSVREVPARGRAARRDRGQGRRPSVSPPAGRAARRRRAHPRPRGEDLRVPSRAGRGAGFSRRTTSVRCRRPSGGVRPSSGSC